MSIRYESAKEKIISFIQSYFDQNLRAPTIREIKNHCGFKSPRAITYYMEKIVVEMKIPNEGKRLNYAILKFLKENK